MGPAHYGRGEGNRSGITFVVSRCLGAGVPFAFGMDFFKLCTPCCTAPGGHLPSQGVCSAMPSFGCCVSIREVDLIFTFCLAIMLPTIISSSVFSLSFFATYSVSLFETSSSHARLLFIQDLKQADVPLGRGSVLNHMHVQTHAHAQTIEGTHCLLQYLCARFVRFRMLPWPI